MDTLANQARELGRVEGRAEALEEIAALHAQIASLHGKIENMILEQGERTKDLLSDVYKDIKATFKQHTELLAPRQVVEICKPSLRRVAELHLGNPTRTAEDLPPAPSSPLAPLHRSQSTLATGAPNIDNADDVRSRRNSAPSQLSTDESPQDPFLSQPSSLDAIPGSLRPPPTTLNAGMVVNVSGCEKVGSGHSAYMVYFVIVQKNGEEVCNVKRRYKDFAWLWERLTATYPFACVPSLPPKSSLLKSGQARFQPAFTERRRRVLDRWLTHIALHDALGRSSFMHSFLFDAVLVLHHDTAAVPPSLPITSVMARPPQAKQRLHRSYKTLHESVPALHRKLQMVTKRSDHVVKAHHEVVHAMDLMRQHCYVVQSFERAHSATALAVAPWEAWRVLASSHMRLHQDAALVWEVHLQEPFAFVHDHVLPRFERQVHELGKDMTPTNVTKLGNAWDDLMAVRSATIVASLVEAATQLQSRHRSIVHEWSALREQLLQPDSNDDARKIPPKTPKFARQRSWDDAVPPLVHPTLGRPLKPYSTTSAPNIDDEIEAHQLFGAAPIPRERSGGAADDATAARTLFGGLDDSSSSDTEMDGPGEPKEQSGLPTAASKDWDLYIERLRRKQISKAMKALAAQEEQAAAAAAAVAEEEAAIRRMRKRPQSLNWPGKRGSHLRLDERVKQGQSGGDVPARTWHRSATSSLDEADAVPGPLPPQATRTSSLPPPTSSTAKPEALPATNWVQVQTDAGQVYYYHKLTRATRWTKPDQAVMESIEERLLAQHEATQRRLEERRQWHEGNRVQQEKDADEAQAHAQSIDAAVATWTSHKDVVAMLNSLHEIFPYKDMRPCHVTDDSAGAVKKAYMKAVRLLHPDKLLPADFTLYQRMLGQHLFSTLTSSFEKYQAATPPLT